MKPQNHFRKHKAALCFFFLFYSFSCVYAQQFKAGLLAGIATTQVDGDTWGGYNKLGLFAGGFLTKKFSTKNNWSASFEITYVEKGARKMPRPDKGDYTEYRLYLNYAEIPILLKYDLIFSDTVNNKFRVQLEGGLSTGVLVSAREYDIGGQLTGGTPFEKTDFNFLWGGTVFLSEKLGFNVRVGYSILPVRKGGLSAYYYNWTHNFMKPGYYNNAVLFSFRYHF